MFYNYNRRASLLNYYSHVYRELILIINIFIEFCTIYWITEWTLRLKKTLITITWNK
jgi:hypothetical protein